MLKAITKGRFFPINQLISNIRMPLFRNGYALILGGITSSALGTIYWILAARYYPPHTVGLNSALISAMLFLSGISMLSLNDAMVRFAPLAGRKTKRLVFYAYLISALAAALFALIFSAGVGIWSSELSLLNTSPILLASFLVATVSGSIFSLQDNVLTSIRQAVWVPIENTFFAIMKIVLLVVLANSLNQYGIFASWTIPVLFLILPVNLFIFRRLIGKHVEMVGDSASPVVAREVFRYAVGNYLGTLFFLASTTFLPVLVTIRAGASANAHFYLPWMIASSLQLIAMNMNTSLTVEGSIDQAKLYIYARHVLIHTIQLLVPVVLVVFIGAPYILLIFGKNYAAEGTLLLRLLAISTIPNIFVMLFLTLSRVKSRIGVIIMVRGSLCFLVLGLGFFFLELFGITGVGYAWLVSQTLVAVVLVLTELRPVIGNKGVAQRKEGG